MVIHLLFYDRKKFKWQQSLEYPTTLKFQIGEHFSGEGDKDVRRTSLRHLLKSNATPSDFEIIVIRALITNAEACWIEEPHRHFPAQDRASQAMEFQLLKDIEARRALLGPVRYLSSKILQDIFLHYADNSRRNVEIATMPWRLGHISHRWRNFALSIPSL